MKHCSAKFLVALTRGLLLVSCEIPETGVIGNPDTSDPDTEPQSSEPVSLPIGYTANMGRK